MAGCTAPRRTWQAARAADWRSRRRTNSSRSSTSRQPPISITTNYLSNFGFFRRYISNSNNIYGLTGTIGDSQTMEILKILYELDFDYIPPEKIRIIKELESKICFCHSLWLENIVNIVKRETNENRAILIISESIDNAEEIFEEIQKNVSGIYLVKIIGKDSEENLIKRELPPKSVIVSTNISGRGTDIKLEKNVHYSLK